MSGSILKMWLLYLYLLSLSSTEIILEETNNPTELLTPMFYE